MKEPTQEAVQELILEAAMEELILEDVEGMISESWNVAEVQPRIQHVHLGLAIVHLRNEESRQQQHNQCVSIELSIRKFGD